MMCEPAMADLVCKAVPRLSGGSFVPHAVEYVLSCRLKRVSCMAMRLRVHVHEKGTERDGSLDV